MLRRKGQRRESPSSACERPECWKQEPLERRRSWKARLVTSLSLPHLPLTALHSGLLDALSVCVVIQYQTVRYDILPLSPVSRNRLSQVKRKILVLDLDETLIHSHHDGVLRPTVRPGTPPDFILKVVIDKHPVRFFVHKRPHVDFFLEVVSQWYELVVFTASMEIYGSAVADKLDNSRSILKRRYYRQHCTLELGSYIKDLSVVHSDLSSIVILDNSPGAYRSHPDNAIPIKSWFSDPSDTALLNLLPMLDALRFTADVRSVLSRNLHQHRLW